MSFNLVGIGEVLWDFLPGGRQLGGAPTNFACQASALGAEACLVSRVGRDELGCEALRQLEKLGVATGCIEVDPSLPTGTVSVEVAGDGQPHYQIHQNVAWDAVNGKAAGRAVALADAVCFGSLAQRSPTTRATIQSLVASAPREALRIFDVNLRQNFFNRRLIEESLALANVLKVNDSELPCLAEMFGLAGDEREQIAQLASRDQLRCVACTRGGRGSLLFLEGRWGEHPGLQTKVVDTVGAGDSFTAAMTLGLLAGWDLERVNENANRVAAYVCSCAGATPALPEKLRALFLPRSSALSAPD